MSSNKYYDPISNEELVWGNDGLLHSPTSNTSYIIDSKKKVIPLISPLDKTLLNPDPNGLLKSKENEIRYQLINGEIIPLLSPIHGGELRLDRDGFYSSKYDNVRYQVAYNGKIIPLLDPYKGGYLIPLADGNFQSKTTGKQFMYDSKRNVMIPLYIPDNSMEDAHLERGYLVGNKTGRGYAINEIGRIMTPEEIKKPLTIEDVQKIMVSTTIHPLTSNFTNDVTISKSSSKVISQVNMTIGEFLTYNGISNEEGMTRYLKDMGMNPRIIELIQKANASNFISMLGESFDAPLSIINKENSKALYIPTTHNSQTSTAIEVLANGSFRMIENHHEPVMVDGIRYGNVSVVEMMIDQNGNLSCVETKHTVEPYDGLQPLESKTRFTITSSMHPVSIITSGKVKLEVGYNMQTVCDTLTKGVLKPVQPNEDMIKKLDTLRKMGFDEKYFVQPYIAGINYDEEGNQTFVENEDLQQIPQLSISIESFLNLEEEVHQL